jgi:tetratricopeptide (TPR) repeat protein
MVLPMLATEPRCGRLDWERSSILVNIGNSYSRQDRFDLAKEQYNLAEQLGQDHLDHKDGNKADGMGILICAMRARAFALKKAGMESEAKEKMRAVLELQKQLDAELLKNKMEMELAATNAGAGNPELIAE